jgi:hypothetical protein
MKKFGILFMLLISLTVSAQSDFEIASEFMSKKGVKLAPNERSTTRGTDVPYSIFNGENDKGFAIVVNGCVVGYDTNNTANEDNMPCCMKELLDMYSKTVKPSRTRGLSEENVKAIEPIIKTHWNQSSPYYDSITQKKNLCFYVAVAQIFHHLKVNFYVEGHFLCSNLPVDLYPTTFDHDLIDREGEEGWAEETARFFKYAKHGYSLDIWYEFETIFGVKKNKDEFKENESRYQVYNDLLENGRPIIVPSPNHYFIVDGRSEDGRYHVNFGWGGYCDGYYVFPDTENDKQNIETNFEYNRDTYYWVLYYTSVNEKTSINPIMCVQTNNAVYNLQGRKVGNSLEGLPKGVYIQNKKKQVVK